MKKSTIAIIVTGLVSLVLSVITGVISIVLLAGATKKAVDDIDIGRYSEQIQEWVDEHADELTTVNVDSAEGSLVQVGPDGVHVESDDGSIVDVGLDGISIN